MNGYNVEHLISPQYRKVTRISPTIKELSFAETSFKSFVDYL